MNAYIKVLDGSIIVEMSNNIHITKADYTNVKIIEKSDNSLIFKGDKIVRERVSYKGCYYEGEEIFEELKIKIHPIYFKIKNVIIFNWRKFKFEKINKNYIDLYRGGLMSPPLMVKPESYWLKNVTVQYSKIPYKLEILE